MIQLRDVHVTLSSTAGPVKILRGVSLDVAEGSSVSVVGPSGSGKSTLLAVIGGIERPTAGTVRIDGRELGDLDEDELASFRGQRIGILFQAFHLIPTMTALENVAVPLELAGARDAFDQAEDRLAELGLAHRAAHYPGQLSGGEQQRVALARALSNHPKLLLADEPTGNLDQETGREIIELLFRVQRERAHDPPPDHARSAPGRALHPSGAHGGWPAAPAGGRGGAPASGIGRRRRMSELALAWRFARRELRGGLQGFVVFLACLTLGVAAIATVGVINAGVVDAVRRDAAALLGGDIRLETSNLPIAEDELAGLMPPAARRSDAVRTNAMASGAEGRRVVVSLKAVDAAYPLYGEVELEPALDIQTALAGGGAVVEPGLLPRLGVALGDQIQIGEATFTVRATMVREPDRLGGFISIGPRVMIGLADLERTEVIVPGSLASYDYRFALPPGMDAAALLADLRRDHPDARWRARGTRDVQPQVTRFTDRLASYLTMAALTTLLIGGVGVALAIQNYLAGKTATIATLKCLGARSRLIFATYLLQVLALAGIGVLVGLTIGQFVPWLLAAALGPLLPIRVDRSTSTRCRFWSRRPAGC